jgi:alkaline phosphatase
VKLTFLRITAWAAFAGAVLAQTPAPGVRILLPERTRLLPGQRVDLVLEVRNAAAVSNLRVTAGDTDLTARFAAPVRTELDCDSSTDWVIRANLQSFETAGNVTLTASLTADGTPVSDTRTIQVVPFSVAPGARPRNVILFIGDAMGTAYRDAARLVSRAIVDSNGRNAMREGFFDNLLEMDKMPVSGMSMTHGTDSIVPDSANTGTAWAAGNKSFLNAVNTFADGTDCRWRFTGATNVTTQPFILDNPRVENLWQYLKRRFNYRTGIVSTADITDATPAVHGSYSGFRQTRFEIARQYVENPMLNGQPAFDVIMGGGLDQFLPNVRPDGRNLIAELQARGYRYVTTASGLREVQFGQPTIGIFRGNVNPRAAADGIRANSDSNMDVAYDKLGLQRPASEPQPNLAGYNDQPMLDLMTQKAIEVLSNSFSGSPFILMVEAASIDKQSHPNHAAGQIWDTVEFDRAVGVARAWANRRNPKDTLLVVTADHDQSMSIIGVANTPDNEYFDRNKRETVALNTPRGAQGFTVYGDAQANARAALPFINGSAGAENNTGAGGTPSTYALSASATDPASSTYSTYFGWPAYTLDARTGYPVNAAPAGGRAPRRLSVGYRTGDHTGSSVPVTAEGPGAFLFTGYMDQTDIFFRMATALSGDTAEADALLEQFLRRVPPTPGK